MIATSIIRAGSEVAGRDECPLTILQNSGGVEAAILDECKGSKLTWADHHGDNASPGSNSRYNGVTN